MGQAWAACGSGGRAGRLVTGRFLVLRCPWARRLTWTAPDKLAVALHGWRRRRCVNAWMNGWMWGNIVKRFEWPLSLNAVYLPLTSVLYDMYLRSPVCLLLSSTCRKDSSLSIRVRLLWWVLSVCGVMDWWNRPYSSTGHLGSLWVWNTSRVGELNAKVWTAIVWINGTVNVEYKIIPPKRAWGDKGKEFRVS